MAPDGSITVPKTAPVVADCAAAFEGSNCAMPSKKIDSQATANTRRACEAAVASWIGKMFLNVFISYPPKLWLFWKVSAFRPDKAGCIGLAEPGRPRPTVLDTLAA